MSLLILLALSVLLLALMAYYLLLKGCPSLPSSRRAIQKMIEIIPHDFSGRVVDLGSGFGSLAFSLSARFSCAQIVGYEISLLPYVFARIFLFISRRKNLRFIRLDFFHVFLSDASVVICYLVPSAMQELKTKLKSELKPGALVISNWFSLPDETPEAVHRLDDIYRSPIYVYRL